MATRSLITICYHRHQNIAMTSSASLEHVHAPHPFLEAPDLFVDDVIVREKSPAPVDVLDGLRVVVDEILVDVFSVLERRHRHDVGDRHFVVRRQKFFVAEKVGLEELVRSCVFVPVFCNQQQQIMPGSGCSTGALRMPRVKKFKGSYAFECWAFSH